MAYDYLGYRRAYDKAHPDKSIRNREKGAVSLLRSLGYHVEIIDQAEHDALFAARVEELRAKRVGGDLA